MKRDFVEKRTFCIWSWWGNQNNVEKNAHLSRIYKYERDKILWPLLISEDRERRSNVR